MAQGERPHVEGKFIFLGSQKLQVRGVTYGTFAPGPDGCQFPDASTVEGDFRRMAGHGINAVRTYTVPPRWLLDIAHGLSLRVMVGLPWEQHVTFLNDTQQAESIVRRVREGVRECAGHPAVLCYAIGNEIPASIVRWHGPRRIEAFLRRLYRAAKEEDPGGLVTYINFPTTEYLQLPFLDFHCFNVYLESQSDLKRYLARLQNLSGDRPLVMAEIGLDSRRNGEERQAEVLDWQIRTVFRGGCAGLFLFAWTDEWHRGGYDIEDWDFGLTRRDRSDKPALAAVRRAFLDSPFPSDVSWPEISVVVCTHNGSRTISETLRELGKLNYSSYEIIVVNDGSTDETAARAAQHDVRIIHTKNRGLSAARNTGLAAANGEIVAYIDDDAYPDRDWLRYLALAFLNSDHAAIGGPNLPPPGDGPLADCVANAPGGPAHVLLTDELAEHIPGCNMAFRADVLRGIGGFDARYRVAGDDVDVCWRLQKRGYTVGFSAAAVVWHHRRNSLRAYWKQQVGYGNAEVLLARNWPEKRRADGNLVWEGRLYGRGRTPTVIFPRNRIYQGVWGSALFQSLYEPHARLAANLPALPAWHALNALLLGISLLGLVWSPLQWAAGLLLLSAALPVPYVLASVRRANFTTSPLSPFRKAALQCLTALLYFAQPLARLKGQFSASYRLWRQQRGGLNSPRGYVLEAWSEQWRPAEIWLREIEERLAGEAVLVVRGGAFDDWDMEVHGGLFGYARVLLAVEEHGGGRQLGRLKTWPRWNRLTLATSALSAASALLAGIAGLGAESALLGGVAVALGWTALRSWSASLGAVRRAWVSAGATSVATATPARARKLPQVTSGEAGDSGAWAEARPAPKGREMATGMHG